MSEMKRALSSISKPIEIMKYARCLDFQLTNPGLRTMMAMIDFLVIWRLKDFDVSGRSMAIPNLTASA